MRKEEQVQQQYEAETEDTKQFVDNLILEGIISWYATKRNEVNNIYEERRQMQLRAHSLPSIPISLCQLHRYSVHESRYVRHIFISLRE